MTELQRIGSIQSAQPPSLSAAEMRAVDDAAIARGLSLLQMMENAGSLLARLTHYSLPGPSRVLVLAGAGGNGGGALVAARRLAGFGHRVEVIMSRKPTELTPATTHQWRLLEQIRAIELHATGTTPHLPECNRIIDGVLGYSLRGAPRGSARALIEAANDHGAPITSLDLPSGLDPDDGSTPGAVIHAETTLTLVLPKHGLSSRSAQPVVGRLALGDIGIAPEWVHAAVARIEPADWYAGGDLQWLSPA